jgi:hypothetical protein
MTARDSFEDWWSKRGHLYHPHMKEGMWICFKDAWDRSLKAQHKVD